MASKSYLRVASKLLRTQPIRPLVALAPPSTVTRSFIGAASLRNAPCRPAHPSDVPPAGILPDGTIQEASNATIPTFTERFGLPSSSFPPPRPTKSALSTKDKPLVWVDCEMTGLSPDKDQILEIAVIITDGNLEPMDAGINYVIRTDASVLDHMDEWCRNTHGATGLTADCRDPDKSLTLEQAQLAVLQYVQARIDKPQMANLAGSSVHFDLRFLNSAFPYLVAYLHYRIVDVSSIFEVVRRWFPKQLWKWSQQEQAVQATNRGVLHRAHSDIQYSLRQLEWYRKEILTANPIIEPEPKKTTNTPAE